MACSVDKKDPLFENPTVSIVMPVYNEEKHLGEMLDYLQNQTFPDYELICIDDGSTDSTPDILAGRANQDPRIRVRQGGHRGASAARNYGMSLARGKYLWFVDADDIIERDALEKLVTTAVRFDAEITLFYFDMYSEEMDEFRPYDWIIDWRVVPSEKPFRMSEVPDCFHSIAGFTVNKFYRMEFLRDLHITYPDLSAHEDMPFSCTALACAERIVCLEDTLYHYRRSEVGGVTNDSSLTYQPMLDALVELRENLQEKGVWDEYAQNFANYAAYMIVWKQSELCGKVAKEFDKDIKSKWLEEFGIIALDRDSYYDMDVCFGIREALEDDYETRRARVFDANFSAMFLDPDIAARVFFKKALRKTGRMVDRFVRR